MRYVAFMIRDESHWRAVLPDFPGIAAADCQIPEALRAAQRAVVQHAALLRFLGATMPTPTSAARLVTAPLYARALLAIIAIAESPQPGDGVFRFGD